MNYDGSDRKMMPLWLGITLGILLGGLALILFLAFAPVLAFLLAYIAGIILSSPGEAVFAVLVISFVVAIIVKSGKRLF